MEVTTLLADAEIDQSIDEHDVEQVPEENVTPEPDDVEHHEQQHHEQKHHDDNSSIPPAVEDQWPGWPGESVFRMLVPSQKVGSIIGRKGEFIKKMVEETRSRIKILDGPSGTSERAVMVSAKEEPDSSLPPAVVGLLRVHERICDGLDADSTHFPPGAKVSTRLLLAASQAGNLIGKQGGTVKSIQESSNCIVRVLGSEDLPIFALQEDKVVEVVGEPTGVHKAVELIATHLRKFLVDRSVIPLFEMQMQGQNPQMDHMMNHIPPQHHQQPWFPPQGFPQNSGGVGPGYGPPNLQYIPPPRHQDNYFPIPEFAPPPMEKQHHQGISAFGREAPIGNQAPPNAQPAPSMITQMTQHMQVPLSYADAVIGTAGANISYIRRASEATVTIQETRGVPTEMTVEINGTASQVQAAQQLIQNIARRVDNEFVLLKRKYWGNKPPIVNCTSASSECSVTDATSSNNKNLIFLHFSNSWTDLNTEPLSNNKFYDCLELCCGIIRGYPSTGNAISVFRLYVM